MAKDQNIYIVSGFMRSGTSMMMDCLRAGGMDLAFNEKRDVMNTQFGDADYQPNPHGFYELGRAEYQQENFPLMYKGKLLKCLFGGLTRMPNPGGKGKLKVVWMWRDPEEIRQSYEAFFDQPPPKTLEQWPNLFNEIIEMCRKAGMEIHEIWFKDVVANPVNEFEKLRDFGFPFDVEEAVKRVDPTLYRFQMDNLTQGI